MALQLPSSQWELDTCLDRRPAFLFWPRWTLGAHHGRCRGSRVAFYSTDYAYGRKEPEAIKTRKKQNAMCLKGGVMTTVPSRDNRGLHNSTSVIHCGFPPNTCYCYFASSLIPIGGGRRIYLHYRQCDPIDPFAQFAFSNIYSYRKPHHQLKCLRYSWWAMRRPWVQWSAAVLPSSSEVRDTATDLHTNLWPAKLHEPNLSPWL